MKTKTQNYNPVKITPQMRKDFIHALKSGWFWTGISGFDTEFDRGIKFLEELCEQHEIEDKAKGIKRSKKERSEEWHSCTEIPVDKHIKAVLVKSLFTGIFNPNEIPQIAEKRNNWWVCMMIDSQN